MAAHCFHKVVVRVSGIVIEGSRTRVQRGLAPLVFDRSYSKFLRHRSQPQQCQQRARSAVESASVGRFHRSKETYATLNGSDVQGEVGDSPNEVNNAAQQLLETESIPDEKAVLNILRNAETLANTIPTEAGSKVQGAQYTTRQAIIERLSKSIYEVVSSPKVFITPQILQVYVNIQSALRCPETLVPVFEQYASKPIPQPGTDPVRFRAQNPKKISAAVPLPIARMAIEAAVKVKNLPICLDIIMNTVCTSAYKRSQLMRRGTLPVTAAFLAPVAAWQIATYYGSFQDLLDPNIARGLTFAGILTYLGATSTLGYIAVTTSNDQMERVTWVDGTPLHERWMREDERALLDQVAVSFGYQQKSRRGEEEGQDWDALREWVGVRGMMLDRVSLMEGME